MSETWRNSGYDPPHRSDPSSAADREHNADQDWDAIIEPAPRASAPETRPPSRYGSDEFNDRPARSDPSERNSRGRAQWPPGQDRNAGGRGRDGEARGYGGPGSRARDYGSDARDYGRTGGRDYDARGYDGRGRRPRGYDEREDDRYRGRGDRRDRDVSHSEDAAGGYGGRSTSRYDGAGARGYRPRDWDASRTRQLRHDGTAPPGGPPAQAPSGSMWGKQTGRAGLAIVFGGTILGGLVCVMFGAGPSWLLWFFVVASTVIAGFAVQQRACYLIIPAPAIAYPLAALPDGYASDPSAHGSLTSVAVGVVQWMAHGFPAIAVATLIAIAITVGRWRQATRAQQGARRRRPPSRSTSAYWD